MRPWHKWTPTSRPTAAMPRSTTPASKVATSPAEYWPAAGASPDQYSPPPRGRVPHLISLILLMEAIGMITLHIGVLTITLANGTHLSDSTDIDFARQCDEHIHSCIS